MIFALWTNYLGEFGSSFSQIYPEVFELKEEHYGDICIDVTIKEFFYKLYDKWGDFSFWNFQLLEFLTCEVASPGLFFR